MRLVSSTHIKVIFYAKECKDVIKMRERGDNRAAAK